jgi:hypothetical protein
MNLNLSKPKLITFWIALLLAVVGVIFFFVPAVEAYALWVVVIAYVVLALGNVVKGM